MTATEIAEEIERLEKETTISLAVRDPKKYKENNRLIEKLRKQFIKKVSG